jgi:hypothetical protein
VSDNIYDLIEAIKYLNDMKYSITKKTMYTKIHKREGPEHFYIGTRLMFTQASLDEFRRFNTSTAAQKRIQRLLTAQKKLEA